MKKTKQTKQTNVQYTVIFRNVSVGIGFDFTGSLNYHAAMEWNDVTKSISIVLVKYKLYDM